MDISLNEQVYSRLRNEIMSLQLIPGEKISAATVAERYDVSRTPAREAIVKLEKEGLLDIIPQSGTRISKIDLKRAQQEWFVRSSLEIDMVPRFISNCKSGDIKHMQQVLEKQKNTHIDPMQLAEPDSRPGSSDAIEYFKLDNEFHSIIYEVAGESLSREIISDHMSHYNRIRFLTDLSPEVRDKTIREHEQIIKASEEHDEEWLQAVLKKHIRRIHGDQTTVVERYPDFFAV